MNYQQTNKKKNLEPIGGVIQTKGNKLTLKAIMGCRLS